MSPCTLTSARSSLNRVTYPSKIKKADFALDKEEDLLGLNEETQETKMNQSDILTVKQENVNYIRIDREKMATQLMKSGPNERLRTHGHVTEASKLELKKFDPEKYFYLAAYSCESFINNDQMRTLLFDINTTQIEQQKSNLGFLNLAPGAPPKKQEQKYFGFPQDIVYAHLKGYEIKVVNDEHVSLEKAGKQQICFVKLYLFEKEIAQQLTKELKKQKMVMKEVIPSFLGLSVMAPVYKSPPGDESMLIINDRLIGLVYQLYKEYIVNFGPNLNASQVLLYLYKQIFNIKYEVYELNYSQHITKVLSTDIVLRYI